ncbi:MAG TPA: copper chaperone [Gammaproteobacteria bacterium]|nr:copper chaperone [Gammaproteobacteria bacterium]
MRMRILSVLLTLFMAQNVLAAGSRYVMRVDGMACPFCAYGIEKKLGAIDGVQNVDVDLGKSRVTVDVTEGTTLGEEQMKKLFEDAGFSYRGMSVDQR